MAMTRPHIQVVLTEDHVPAELEHALCRAGATASFWPLNEALRNTVSAAADAVIIVAPEDFRPVADRVRLFFSRLAERPRATLIFKSGGGAVPRLTHPATVPVVYCSGSSGEELSIRLNTMLAMRQSLSSLHDGMVTRRASEENATRRFQNQLRLASQLQREFLPQALPRYGAVSFRALYRPADYVSGDIYDVQRLDEHHVGIAIADATGHGIPAALLTVFVKRALRGTEIRRGGDRILPPDEVLAHLNREILEADLSECRFVAAAYGVLNTRTLELSVARGGAPCPILRHADGTTELVRTDGSVVGILPEPTFEVATLQLQRGDALMLYTDGLERVVCPRSPQGRLESLRSEDAPDDAFGVTPVRYAHEEVDWAAGGAVAVAAPAVAVCEGAPTDPGDEHDDPLVDNDVSRSVWYRTLRDDGPLVALDQLAIRYQTLRRMGCPLDDLTVLTLRVDA